MMTSVKVCVFFGYIYRLIDMIARCHTANDIFDEILSHSLNDEMFN